MPLIPPTLRPPGAHPADPLEAPVKGLLRLKPAHLLDFLQHFIVFETKRDRTTKMIARYHQFEAVNELLDRTVALVGHPVSAQDRTGLIWHTQGSGKSSPWSLPAKSCADTRRSTTRRCSSSSTGAT